MFKEPLYQIRNNGDKIDVTFAFVRENFKSVLKSCMLYSLPFSLLLLGLFAYFYVLSVWNPYATITNDIRLFIYEILYIAFAIDLIIITPLALTLVDIDYNHGGLKNKKLKDTWIYFKRNMMKTLAMPFLQIALFLVIFHGITFFERETNHLLWMMFAYLILILGSYCLPAFCIGKQTFSKSIQTIATYGIGRFFNTLFFTFIMFIICILIFFWEIMLAAFLIEVAVDFLGTNTTEHIIAYSVFGVVLAFIWIVFTFTINLALITFNIGLVFQYGTAEEKHKNISIKEKIENFENLKDL